MTERVEDFFNNSHEITLV